MANNTFNPIPSSDPRDLFDNAATIDMIINSGEDRVPARFGQMLYTWGYFHRLVETAVVQIDGVIANATSQVNAARDNAVADMAETAAALGSDLNNKHYSTYAKMLADPQNRDAVVAIVDADPSSSLNGWYYWDNSSKTWRRWNDQPVLESKFETVSELIASSPTPQRTHVFEDENGFAVAALTDRGSMELEGGLSMSSADIGQGAEGFSVEDTNGFRFFTAGPDESYINGMYLKTALGGAFEFVDEKGFILGRLDKDSIKPSSSANATGVSLNTASQLRTQIMHVIGYGQSLGRGVNALPAISTAQPYKNIMIASGVRSREGESGYYPEAFSPLIEQSGSFEGETPISGLCNGVVRRALVDGENQDDWVFLGSALGQGGRSIEQLMPSTDYLGYFNKMVRMVSDSQALATKSGKSYSVWAYSWDQGESNYENASYTRSAYLYTQYMLNLFDRLSESVAAITGQAFRPYVFSYQVGAHRKYNRSEMTLALSQWRASRDRPDFVMAVPVYVFKTGSDSLHLTNESSWLLGEYKSRAMYVTMIRRGKKWRPLEPVSVVWGDNYIDIKFNVPSGALVLDYALCNQTANYGFDVWEGGQLADIVNGVSVVGDETVRVSISRPASSSAILSYAKGRSTDTGSGPENGARGNLRDSNGDFDKVTSPLGNVFALHNPCVMFQYDRISGF